MVPRAREAVIAVGALFVTTALFVVLAIVGYPVVYELLDTTPLRRLLLAPVTGLCAMTVPVATLNHLGMPVSAVGRPVLFAGLFAAAVYYAVRRPRIPWREARPFVPVVAVALAVAAWPMARFGFDWLSFANDDMTTYLLGGNHFFAHGYFQLPPAGELFNERDPSWNTSFFYSFDEVRYAAPLMLAWVMSVAGLGAGAAFMPMIVALHLVVVVSAGALVAARGDRGRAALVTCLVLAVSANLLSGTLRQLLPQNFGLAVLAGAAALLMRPPPVSRAALLKGAALGSLFVGTLAIAYPEVMPFLIVPALVYVTLSIRQAKTSWRAWALVAGVVVLGSIAVANENVPGSIALLLKQSQVAAGAGAAYDRALFAEFLTPLVFPLLWGFITVGATFGVWSVVAVICGLLATLGAGVAAVRYSFALEPAALILVVMLIVFVQLMWTGGSFGLFKLAMYVQPFLLATVACVLVDTFALRAAREPA